MSKILKLQHFIDADICVTGMRAFAKENGLSFRHFARHGMTEEEYSKYEGNAFFDRALEKMRAE